jgi:hypothetical protein
MFKQLINRKGQGMFVQYTLTFFLVVGFVTAMTVYVRRVVQARIRGAGDFMGNQVNEVWSDPAHGIVGNFYLQYEPYYASTKARKQLKTLEVEKIIPAGKDGIAVKEYPYVLQGYNIIAENTTTTETQSTQASPENAD